MNWMKIASKDKNWVKVIEEFYTPFEINITEAKEKMDKVKLPDKEIDEACPQCGKPIVIKSGASASSWRAAAIPTANSPSRTRLKPAPNARSAAVNWWSASAKRNAPFTGAVNIPNASLPPLTDPCRNLPTVRRAGYGAGQKLEKMHQMQL
jgi:DNA topoisomerase-1